VRKTLISIVLFAACTDSSVGPVVTPNFKEDQEAPRLTVIAPLRGTTQEGPATSIEVRGRVEDKASTTVRVNGQLARVDVDGSWAVTVPLRDGMNFLHTSAFDAHGNVATDTRAVLAGPLVSTSTPVTNGIVARLDARAVRAAGTVAAARLASLDLGARVARHNPVFENPVPCVRARADVARLTVGSVRLELWPVDSGLGVDAELRDVQVSMDVLYSDSCTTTSTKAATARSSSFRFSGKVLLALDANGQVVADRGDVDAYFADLELGGELPDKVVRNLEDELAEALGARVADEVAAQVPSAILSGLGAGDRTIELGGQTLEIVLRPTELNFDYHGVSVAVDSQVALRGAGFAMYLTAAASRPSLDVRRALSVGVADDVLNQFVASLWAAGQLDGAMAAGVAPGLTYEAVELSPRLPPVLTALPGGGGLRLQIGDVEASFLRGGQTVARVALSAEMTLGVSAAEGRMRVIPLGQHLYANHLHDGLGEESPADFSVEIAGQIVAESLLGSLTSALAYVPLPAAAGVMPVAAQAFGLWPETGYLVMAGD
jgi:hypothetical protein